MPKVSRESASQANEHGPISERREDIEGTAIQFLTTHVDLDATPLMKGLPDDRCSSPHWGYVFTGRLTFDCGDHEEVSKPAMRSISAQDTSRPDLILGPSTSNSARSTS